MKMLFFLVFFQLITHRSIAQDSVKNPTENLDLYAGSFNTVYAGKVSINPSVYGYLGSFYFENRYNYEAINSASVNAGIKLFKKIKHLEVVPIFGVVVGNYKAVTTEVQSSVSTKNLLFSSDNQLSIGYGKPKHNLYLDWSILRYRIYKGFEIGPTSSFQKISGKQSTFDPGLTLALTVHDWYLRFYTYSSPNAKPYYWLGLRYHVRFKINR